MKIRKIYDIVITEGEFNGWYKMSNIESKEVAEMLKEEYFANEPCAIVEREEESVETFEDLVNAFCK